MEKTLYKFVNKQHVQKIFDKGVHKYYLSYPIPKSNGKQRWLDAPQDELKQVQEDLLENLLYRFTPHNSAIGFKPGVSMIKGPKQHLQSEVMLSMDFKDYFTSIKKDYVYRFTSWMSTQLYNDGICDEWSDNAQTKFANLVTYKGYLPQGAPTSPTLSNLITYPLDVEISKIADKYDVTYTRYADDITFSSDDEDMDIMEIYPEIEGSIESFGLPINHKKTRIRRQHQRMVVTGVVVNDKLSVPKWKWRNFRAKLHNLKMSQQPLSKLEYQQITGYAQWIKQLHPKRGERFLQEIGKLNCPN